MIFSITNPTELVDWLQIFCKSGWLSPWAPPLQWGKIHERSYRPATHPIHFAADSPDKIIAALRGRYFSFLGTCQGKVPPSCCARPFRCLKNHWGFHCYATLANANRTLKISWADRTWYRLSVNAAAKQGQELRSEQTAINIHEQWNSLLIFAS